MSFKEFSFFSDIFWKFGAGCLKIMFFALAKLRGKDLISATKCFVSYFYSLLFVRGPVFIGLAMFCFCSVLRHMAVVDVIVGTVFNKCIDQCLMSP